MNDRIYHHVRVCVSRLRFFDISTVHVLIDFNYLKRQSCIVRYYYCDYCYCGSTHTALSRLLLTFAAILILQAVARFCQSILITIRTSP